MAKKPRMGLAKTRLAKKMGNVNAWSVYNRLLNRTLKLTRDDRWTSILAVAHEKIAHNQKAIAGEEFSKFIVKRQGKGDLGHRQLEQINALPLTAKKIIIGTDCPQITRQRLWSAFHQIERNRMVVGPTLDGGYYLLGLIGRLDPRIFHEIQWSTPNTRRQLEFNLKSAGKRISRLDELMDIDDINDYKLAKLDSVL